MQFLIIKIVLNHTHIKLVNKNFDTLRKVSYFSNFGSLILNLTITFWPETSFCSVASLVILWSKITFSKLFQRFLKLLFFNLEREKNYEQFATKNHWNPPNSSGDIVLRGKKIITIFWLWKKVKFYGKIEVGPRKSKNYIQTNVIFHSKAENQFDFFLRPLVYAGHRIS